LTTSFTDGGLLSLYVDARAVRDSAHELLSCVTCHDDYEVLPLALRDPIEAVAYRREATEMCARCHLAAADGYEGSVHSEPPLESGEGASCVDCHSPDSSAHSVARTSAPDSPLAPSRVDGACAECHAAAVDSYLETSHGKVARLGDAKTTPTCIICHADHAVTDARDLTSDTRITAFTDLCRDCHSGADSAFARAWPGHSEGAPDGSLANLARRAGLLTATLVVAFGLLHVSLEGARRLRDREDGTK
jgi:nitrate/TMAO reductase-like tetraheme cytochrome c subunit